MPSNPSSYYQLNYANDSFSEHGAQRLADTIKQFWKDRGEEVKTWITAFDTPNTSWRHLWAVKSDMINGKPR